jgi:hypothetical protein
MNLEINQERNSQMGRNIQSDISYVPPKGIYRPTLQELMEWSDEGGCLTACEHEAWVEPDGHCCECEAPSWLIVRGFI